MEKTRLLSSLGHSSRANLPSLNLAIISILFLLSGCSGLEVLSPGALPSREGVAEEVKVMIDVSLPSGPLSRADSWTLIKRLDLFVFDEDNIGALDSYVSYERYIPEGLKVASAGGAKIVAAVANMPQMEDFISRIGCLEDLRRVKSELSNDNPDTPVMSGTGRFRGKEDTSCLVSLAPMMSRVELKDLSFEVSGSGLTEVKVYLTGISSSVGILQEKEFMPSGILNFGELSEKDLALLPSSGMVYRYLGNGRKSSGKTVFGPATLYCYPNESTGESLGSPFTRLVIEGKVNGEKRFWSVAINREMTPDSSAQDAIRPGIGRNTCYSYSITIRTTGSTSLSF